MIYSLCWLTKLRNLIEIFSQLFSIMIFWPGSLSFSCIYKTYWDLVKIYHSIVSFNPSLKSFLALNPNSRKAFVVSSILLGWPSGFDLYQTIRPLTPFNSAISSTSSFMDISTPAPIFTGSLLLYLSAARSIPSAASFTYRNSLVGLPVPQTVIGFWFPASIPFFINAGITWDDSGSKLSLGPQRLMHP